MVWKEILNTAKETGERVIGRGPEVDFRQDVEVEVKARGISKARAEKETFLDRVTGVKDEARLSGAVDYRSEHWRDFEAGMNELFDRKDKAAFKENAENPLLFRRITLGPVSAAEYTGAKNYFKGKFGGEEPEHYELDDTPRT